MDEEKKKLAGAYDALQIHNIIPPAKNPEEEARKDAFVQQESQQAEGSLLHSLRTFESDAADAIRQGKESVYSIQQAEKTKQAKAKRPPETAEKRESKKNAVLLLFSVMIFLAGASYGLYFFLLRQTIAPPEITKTKTLIASQTETELKTNGDTSALPNQIKNLVSAGEGQVGTVENIKITNNASPLDIGDILTSLEPGIPSSLFRSFNKQEYMFGTIQKDVPKPFFIIRVDYYDNALAGMLKWEPQLGGIFSLITNTASASSSFSDILVRNKDARVAKDSDGTSRVIYSFYDKQTLVITTDEPTLTDIIQALSVSTIIR